MNDIIVTFNDGTQETYSALSYYIGDGVLQITTVKYKRPHGADVAWEWPTWNIPLTSVKLYKIEQAKS